MRVSESDISDMSICYIDIFMSWFKVILFKCVYILESITKGQKAVQNYYGKFSFSMGKNIEWKENSKIC